MAEQRPSSQSLKKRSFQEAFPDMDAEQLRFHPMMTRSRSKIKLSGNMTSFVEFFEKDHYPVPRRRNPRKLRISLKMRK